MQLSELKGKESACLISKLNVKGFMPPPPIFPHVIHTENTYYTVIRQKLVCWLYKSEFRISGLVLSDVLQQLPSMGQGITSDKTKSKTGNGREHVCTWEGALSTGWISRNVDQLFDHMHLELPRFESSLGQSLFCCHTANVIIEDKPGVEEGDRASVLRTGWFVDRDVERPTILLVSRNFNILQKKKKKIGKKF